MTQNNNQPKAKKLAIIGVGPRGLSALESIYARLSLKDSPESLHTLLFEAYELPGAGHVYDLAQPDTNWLNVSERGLTIPSRPLISFEDFTIPSFPSYHEWAGYSRQAQRGNIADKFPLRSTLGKYLNERFLSIANVLEKKGLLKLVFGAVVKADWKGIGFEIEMQDGTLYKGDELVLTIGHQPTKNSEQIANWLAHYDSKPSVGLITEPYPIKNMLNSKILDIQPVVALRGFGLAMIDLMRALTTGRGGTFECIDETTQEMTYLKSGKEPTKIIPFSLDGLPMAPKPLNLKIDAWFFPSEEEKQQLEDTIGHKAEIGSAKNKQFLIDAMVPIIANVFEQLGPKAYPHNLRKSVLQDIIGTWLTDADFKHPLVVPTSDPTEEILKAFVGMATGTKPISLDFCIGHVWRHCQPILYKALSFSNLGETVIADIVQLDERLKRYSYGPPVASLQQLLALIKAELVSLTFVNDPKIETTKEGWQLSKGKHSILVPFMVNSVLDPPKLLEVNAPIVRNLLQSSLVKPVHSELGIETLKDGCVSLNKENDNIPLAILGRLCKGTLIGVDAILECFGIRSGLWAQGVVDRLSN